MNSVGLVSTVLVLGCVGAFLYAVRRRWFAKLERGFLLTLMLALAGVGLATALLLGIWSYEAARNLLFEDVVEELQNLGGVVETEIHTNISIAVTQLNHLAESLSPMMTRVEPKKLQESIRDIQKFNDWFLQVSLYDREGKLLLSSSTAESSESPNRVAVAYGLEGKPFASDAYFSSVFKKYVLYLAVPLRADSSAEPVGVLSVRYALQEDLAGHVGQVRVGKTGYAVLTDNNGHILAHPDAKRMNEDLSSYPFMQQGRQGQTGWMITKNKKGEQRLFAYHPVKNPATINPKPWILLIEIGEEEALALLYQLRYLFLVVIAVVILAGLVVARQLSLYIRRPLHELLQVLQRVQQGDLSAKTSLEGRDEMGQLAHAFNEMVRGLQERDRVKELFGRYVATQVSEEILKGQINLGGESRRATILFSDIRNFTSMAEEMAPNQVVAFLNDYFSEMVEAVFEQGGVLDKFIGDGMMAVFGSFGDTPDHPRRAVLAALRMKALLAKINGERSIAGKPPVAIGIGIHTDDVVVGNIGSRKRLEYTVVGDGVNTAARVESLNKEFGTTVLITESTYEAVKDEFEYRPMPEASLKGKNRELRFYEVISAKGV